MYVCFFYCVIVYANSAEQHNLENLTESDYRYAKVANLFRSKPGCKINSRGHYKAFKQEKD